MSNCSSCDKIPDYYSNDYDYIKYTGLCAECLVDYIRDIVEKYIDRDVMFGFDEEIEVSNDIVIKGYTYYCYDVGMQFYVPDQEEVYQRLQENGLLQSRIDKAIELFGDADKENIASADDWFAYMEMAKGIKETLEKDEDEAIEVKIYDEDNSIFVDVILSIFPENGNIEKMVDNKMDFISDTIRSYKY